MQRLLLLTLTVFVLFAQTTTSRIRGVVTDTSGALVPGAEVSALHQGTGLVRHMVTNASGQYGFEALPLGPYTITVTMQGFKKVVSSGNELQIGEPLSIDIVLEP